MAETPALHRFPAKDSNEVLDYTYDFIDLLQTDEKISSIDVVTVLNPASNPPLTVNSSGIVGPADKQVTLIISGGVNCIEYMVRVRIITDAAPPITIERSCILPVRNR